MKILYIASLSHSGSTLLDLILSGHSRVVGLGEVYHWLDPVLRRKHLPEIETARCACGATLAECEVWGPFARHLMERPDAPYEELLERLFAMLRGLYGEDVVLSDSSKYRKPLARLLDAAARLGLVGEDVRVLHLTKDVRSFVATQKRKKRRGQVAEFRHFLEWWVMNRKLEGVLRERGATPMRLGYEELCLYPEAMTRRICEFAGLDYEPAMLDLQPEVCHVGLGNPMRNDPDRRARIFYDHRWFIDRSIAWKYPLFFWLWGCNERLVYGNLAPASRGDAHYRPMR